eukprot:TRINITY_DN6431_c0_g2_i4.p2 TRINITY_DN6431_c0_g2~~TRINITY_DN6431_c0_g2_i4.p2  ORF type:complete len:100 (+),score=3.48 TRINITY_DN6431_c0_g2_i4:1163-1462(+)
MLSDFNVFSQSHSAFPTLMSTVVTLRLTEIPYSNVQFTCHQQSNRKKSHLDRIFTSKAALSLISPARVLNPFPLLDHVPLSSILFPPIFLLKRVFLSTY